MKNIIFVHGMFQNPKSWDGWIKLFTGKGYNCVAPAWPMHEGEPAHLRANPTENLGKLHLQDVLDRIEPVVASLENPIMIGHSVGGLITQIMINRGKLAAGVAVNSVAPNDMIDFDWAFLKNAATITNPLKGNEPALMDEKTFHGAFANTLTEAQAKAEFERTAIHDSRNMLRDCLGPLGRIDLEQAHNPLLLISGSEDKITPADLNEKNFKAYKDDASITAFRKFEGRSHYICNEPGWEEVATYCERWIEGLALSAGDRRAA